MAASNNFGLRYWVASDEEIDLRQRVLSEDFLHVIGGVVVEEGFPLVHGDLRGMGSGCIIQLYLIIWIAAGMDGLVLYLWFRKKIKRDLIIL
jgi:hypothetical protein